MMGGAPGGRAGLAARGHGGGIDRGPSRAGWAGLAASSVSIALTFAIAAAGPSVMEPALPGQAGQPPWSFGLHLSPYLAVALTATALAAGTLGVGLCLRAVHRGWRFPARPVLVAGILAAAALVTVPPFGSSDQLSYAAYGRMVVTGHDPYTTTPAMLARLGDPVARGVQDWRHTPSVYGSVATGGQALASWIGGDSARLTVFVLSVLNVAAFAGTGLLLHRLTRGNQARQLRAALLWAFNPLLLQVLVAGAHVDTQAVVFGVAAIAVFSLGWPADAHGDSGTRRFAAAAGAGAVAGLGFAVKLTMVLVPAGLLAVAVLAWWPRARPPSGMPTGRPGPSPPWHRLAQTAGGLAAGFAVIAGAAFTPWGLASLAPALRAGSYVSIGSPWRPLRSALTHWLAIGETAADDVVRAGALALMLVLAVLFLRPLRDLAARSGPIGEQGTAAPAAVAAAGAFAAGFAWLVAWPYVLPWYEALAWALLALLPWSAAPGRAWPWATLDWLVLARTAALSFGYLPARGITMPAGLDWLRSVVRTGVTPVILLAVTVVLVVMLWPRPADRARA